MRQALGSAVFNFYLFALTATIMLYLWVLMLISRKAFQRAVTAWPRGLNWALRNFCGIRFEVRGRENVPAEPVIYASKHQSTWETAYFLAYQYDIAYIMKRELARIPLWGMYMAHGGHIMVDRKGGPSAMRRMIQETKNVLDSGRSVIIFPEGTRTPPGQTGTYFPGVAAMYTQTGATVVPVALNSGLFWGRRSFLKHPGTIVMEFLPPMPKDLDRKTFMRELETRIETATRRLEREAGAVAGHLSANAENRPQDPVHVPD